MEGKIEFRRDKDGNLVAYKDGKPLGEIKTTADQAKKINKQ